MSRPIGAKARIPNAALQGLDFLVGAWRTQGVHPLAPGETLQGRTSFAWHEGGAFLIMRSEVDHPAFPDGLAIIGSDGDAGRVVMTYFDERGVSRLLRSACFVGFGDMDFGDKIPIPTAGAHAAELGDWYRVPKSHS